MAQYGYSAGYQGGGPQAVPSGFIEAYAQAGRNIGQGAQAIGSAIGESLQRYGQNKEENQFLTSRLESLAPYLQTVAQSGNIMDKNTPESKLLGDIEKFSSMSIPQKKATLLNAEFFLDRADKAKAREMQDIQSAAAQQQLAMGALQLGEAQREAEAAPYFTQALIDLYARQPGQGPTAPYADVTQEVMDKYGGNLTQKQVQALIPLTRRMGQTLPSGIVPTGATVGPEGTKVEYGLPATPTAIPVAGAPGYFQTMVGGKAVGDIKQIQPQVQAKINELPEQQQKWANEKQTELSKDPSLITLNEQVKTVEEMKGLPPSPAGDIAMIIKYLKTLDPTSVVSDREFKTLGNAGSLPTQVQNWYNTYATGNKLTPEVRAEILASADSVLRGGIKAIQPTIEDAISAGKYRGVPEEAILPLNTIKRWREVSQQSQAQTMQRFQSPADMKAAGVTRGLVFNPANGKYSEYIQD
jgi:hypothetical protein